MILTSFFSFASIFLNDETVDNLHFDDLACKYYEFFPLWYIYVRTFLPKDHHIYIVDSGSPLPLEPILQKLPEKYEIIYDEDSFTLNPNVTIHAKRYNQALEHRAGASRCSIDYLKMCYHNNLDYTLVESDVLIAYDIFKDFKKPFVTQKYEHYHNTYFQGAICHINKDLIQNRVRAGYLTPYFNADKNRLSFIEGDYYRTFCQDKNSLAELTRPDKYIHKTTAVELKNFLLQNRIEHPYVNAFLQELDVQIAKRSKVNKTPSTIKNTTTQSVGTTSFKPGQKTDKVWCGDIATKCEFICPLTGGALLFWDETLKCFRRAYWEQVDGDMILNGRNCSPAPFSS